MLVFEVAMLLQLFDAIDELPALLQSIPELCVVLLYEGVVAEVGDIMLFMFIAGRTCCWGWVKEELPIPGFAALRAGKEELSVFNVLSGVMALLCGLGAPRLLVGGGETGGVDQEKVAAGDAVLDAVRLVDGREGRIVEDVADAGAFAHGSPPNISVPPEDPCCPPRTRASKSVSPFPLLVSKPLVADGPPKDMNSLRVVAVEPFAPSSCSLRVCSFSTRADVDLIRLIYAWNCCKLSSGPKLKFHKIGSTSIARKSLSTWVLMALKTSSAAICTIISMTSVTCSFS